MKKIVTVSYKGNCLNCHERQYGSAPEKVDVDCDFCEAKKELAKIHDTKYKALERGVVHSITGYDKNGMPSMMTIETKEFLYCIEFKELKIESI